MTFLELVQQVEIELSRNQTFKVIESVSCWARGFV